MGKLTIIQRLKQIVASIGWKLFIWGNETTPEQYWSEIYEQEVAERNDYSKDW